MVAAAILAMITAVTSVATAAAAGRIEVLVESATGVPVAGAVVLLVGGAAGRISREVTNASGKAEIPNLGSGPYRLEIRSEQYQGFVEQIEVRDEKTAQISVQLVALKSIGTVRAKRAKVAFVDLISERSRIRKVSPDLISALRDLGGVTVTPVNGVGALLSIRGQDATATQYQVNGVSLAGSGAGASVNSDLLAQASVDQRNDVVNFQYLSPTLAPHYTVQTSSGGFGSALDKVTAQGTTGTVGFAFVNARRRQSSVLDGAVYADLSGQIYRHSGFIATEGTYLKASGPLGTWVGSIQSDMSRSVSSPIATYFSGAIPAGYGPGEQISTRSYNVAGSANGGIGHKGNGASVFFSSWASNQLDDDRTRTIGGLGFPTTIQSDGSGRSFGFAVASNSPYFKENISLQRRFSRESSQITLGSVAPALSTITSEETGVDLTLDHGSGDRTFRAVARGSLSKPGGFSFEVEPSLTFKSTQSDSWTLSAIVGNRAIAADSAQTALIDPRAANFDCTGGTISLVGPGDTKARPLTAGLNAAWFHQGEKAQYGLTVYGNHVRSAMLTNALVPLANEPPGYLTAGFVDALRHAYSTTGGCTGPAPDADHIFFLEDVAGISALYAGAAASYARPLGSTTTVELTATYTAATVTALDPRLRGALSPYIVGRQLPNVAPYSLGATLDTLIDKRGTEALLHLQYTGSNNDRNLPPYAQYSAAFIRPLGKNAALSIVATNLTNSYAGAFVSPLRAVPLPTTSGAGLATLASPLRPATVYIQLTIKRLPPDEGF